MEVVLPKEGEQEGAVVELRAVAGSDGPIEARVVVALLGGATVQVELPAPQSATSFCTKSTLGHPSSRPLALLQYEGVRFAGSQMIPWPNRLRDGQYEWNNRHLKLEMNEVDRQTAIHGLLYSRMMQIQSHKSDHQSAEVTLHYQFDGKDEGYPFQLDVQLIYRLLKRDRGSPRQLGGEASGSNPTASTSSSTSSEFELEVETIATNVGNEKLPFAVGWHPYFRLFGPSAEQSETGTGTETVDELFLSCPIGQQIEVDADRLLPTGQIHPAPPFETQSLRGRQFDGGYRLALSSSNKKMDNENEDKYFTKVHNKQLGLSLVLWQDQNFPYIQIYIPPSRLSIALEPMSHPVDAFNSGPAVLEPVATHPTSVFQAKYGLFLEPL